MARRRRTDSNCRSCHQRRHLGLSCEEAAFLGDDTTPYRQAQRPASTTRTAISAENKRQIIERIQQLREAGNAAEGAQDNGERAPKQVTSKICRECLKEKPISAFPNPRRAKCESCGGLPVDISVRAWRGGLPGSGRR